MKVKINNHQKNIQLNMESDPLPPTLFNIYMNVRIVKWNQMIYTNGVTLSTSTKINTVLFTNIQVMIQMIIYRQKFLHCKTWQIILKWKYHLNNLRRWHFQDKTQ